MSPSCPRLRDRYSRSRQRPWSLRWALASALVGLATAAAAQTPSPEALLDEAAALDLEESAESVDLYFQAAAQAAQALFGNSDGCPLDGRWQDIYCDALAGLINSGQRFGRLDPRGQLTVVDHGPRVIPVRHYGFAWRPVDFSRLVLAQGEENRNIGDHIDRVGLGLPLVAERLAACQEPFFRPWQPFAATAVLRPTGPDAYALELYNPLAIDVIPWGDATVPLAGDFTAPLAATVNETPRQYFRAFTAPSDTTVQPQLVMIEPYQRGKIPVVFIHGLYSDALTWADMINELRARPDLYARYQFWAFRYPTGGNLLGSAAALRAQLQQARSMFDPDHTDPAFDQMVLVGHSLGGLVALMQVTTSYDLLWRAAAVQPFDAVRAPPALRERLARDFFYEPSPMVSRVIFIGTPHRGSGMARRLAGKVGTVMVNFGSEEETAYRNLMEANPDVFKPEVAWRRPTTIQLLDPDSPFLEALAQMPIACRVRTNTILGDGGKNPFGEPSDGVVPVSSAQHGGESELVVTEEHERLHRHEETIAEVARILRQHAATAGCAGSPGVLSPPSLLAKASASSSAPSADRGR